MRWLGWGVAAALLIGIAVTAYSCHRLTDVREAEQNRRITELENWRWRTGAAR